MYIMKRIHIHWTMVVIYPVRVI